MTVNICLWAILRILCLLLVLPCVSHAAELRIVDDAGCALVLDAPAVRILPLYAAMSDYLTELGIADRIVARTLSDDIAPQNAPVVGTHIRPTFELIIGAQPDLVLVLEGREEAGILAQRLQNLGIPVARFRIASFQELFSCIERIGVLTATETRAAAYIDALRDSIAALRADGPEERRGPSVFFELRYPNLLGAGGGNMLTDITRLAGGENCLAAYPQRLVRLSEEMLVVLNPDLYVVLQGPMNKNPVPLHERPHFTELAAVRNGTVLYLKEEDFSRPGRASIRALATLADVCRNWRLSRP